MVDRLTPAESGMVERDATASPWHVTEVTLLEGDGLDVDEVRARVAERIAYAPRFRQCVQESLAGDTWVDDAALDLEKHVRHVPLRRGATLAEVQGFVSELLHAPLTRHHPRWEIGVVESVQGRRSALITRVCPAWVDGVAGVHLLQELLDDYPNPDEPIPAAWEPQAQLTGTEESLQTVAEALRDPMRVLGGVGGLLGRLTAKGNAQLVSSRPRTLHVGGTGCSVESLQRVARHFGCAVHDVVVAMVVGGLQRRGQRDEPLALIPLAVEEDGPASALGFGVEPMTCALPVRAESPVDRLEQVVTLNRAQLESGRLVAAPRMVELPGFAPATLHVLAARQSAAGRPGQVLIANVPGPQLPRYLGTRRVKAGYPVLGLTGSQELSVGVTTMSGQAWFGLCGTDPVAELAVTMIDELQALLRLVEED